MNAAVARLVRYRKKMVGYPDSISPCMTVGEVIDVANHVAELELEIIMLEKEITSLHSRKAKAKAKV